MGVQLSPGYKAITIDRKQLLQTMPIPNNKDEILSFLGLAGFLHSWIPNFSLLAAPLYEASQGPLAEPLLMPVAKTFYRLQLTLLQALALHLPDLTRPFSLYVSERQGFALGVLGHMLGPSFAWLPIFPKN